MAVRTMRVTPPLAATAALLAGLAAAAPAAAQVARAGAGTEEVARCAPRGDEPEAARRARSTGHYQRGLVLYEQGDYLGAVREFVSGHCDLPDPDFYYNIAQAFERLLEYEKAVAYFERFLRETDEKARNRPRAALRVEVLRNLPGRITVATVPPGADVTLLTATGVAARTVANRDPIPIRRGTYTMRVTLAGHEPLEQQVTVEIGQPYSFYLRLEPKKGTVRVVASPSDARLFLDDRLVGVGGYVETVPIGTYTLTIEREGRQTQRRALVVEAGRTAEVGVRLPERPRSGRRELIGGATLGLGVTSAVALGGLLGQDATVSAGGAAVGLGLGFGAAYLGIPDDVPVGQTSLIIGATLIGATEGLLAGTALACDAGAGDGSTVGLESCDGDVVAGVALSGGASCLRFGALAAPRLDLDAGDAALINSGALWGLATGAMFYAAFDTDDRVRDPLLLAGLNVGVVAGATLAARLTVSRSRIALIDLSGLAGIVAGVAVGQSLDSDAERLNHYALLGLASGLITGAILTRTMDEPAAALGTLRPVVGGDDRSLTIGVGGAL